MSRQIWNFIVHLRWHYQVFILSGAYLMGGFLSPVMDWGSFLLQFVNVHLLLFGGATAYNSFWDKDEGPVGGLKNPPRMAPWMWHASLFLQVVGLAVSVYAGLLFAGIYALSMIMFWLYSSPLARWKSTPVKSLVAIGISTGTNSMLMGYLAAGGSYPGIWILLAAAGTALVILSLYPVSQIYQLEQDRQRGDRTFAVKYGIKGVRKFFKGSFAAGILSLLPALWHINPWVFLVFGIASAALGTWITFRLNALNELEEDYAGVMRIKYGTSFAFMALLAICLLVRHTGL